MHKEYQTKLTTVEKAAELVQSNDHVFFSSVIAPFDLMNAITERYQEIEDVKLFSSFLMKPFPFLTEKKYVGHLHYTTFFMSGLERHLYPNSYFDVNSVHFSNIARYTQEIIKPRIFMAAVSPMDEDGYFYYGPMGTSTCQTAAQESEVRVLQVNNEMPRTNGEGHRIHLSDVDYVVEKDFELPGFPEAKSSDIDRQIAQHIIPRIKDGSTFQVGIGGLGNAISYGLEDKKKLSVHTEMITESMMYLAKKGTITGKIIGGFALGSVDLYKFAGESDQVYLEPIHLANKLDAIASYDDFVSINTCLMADLTGQIASEAVGTRLISSTGGASDFVRGATKSKGGQSFICLPSTKVNKKDGTETSNIVFSMPPATPVTVQRSDVQYVVTEYGIADLYNRTLSDRVRAMINIANPKFRDELRRQAEEADFLH